MNFFSSHSQTFVVLIDEFAAKEQYILFIYKGYPIIASRRLKIVIVAVKSV